jgi:hypothetical protein
LIHRYFCTKLNYTVNRDMRGRFRARGKEGDTRTALETTITTP